MKPIKTVVPFFFSLLLSPLAFGQAVKIRSVNYIAAESIRLIDIVEQRDSLSPSSQETFAAITITKSPNPGKKALISRYYIQEKIKTSFLPGNNNFQFEIPLQVQITRKGQKIPTEQIKQAIEAIVINQINIPGAIPIVKGIRYDKRTVYPLGIIQLDLDWKFNSPLIGKKSIPLTVKVNNRQIQRIWVFADIVLKVQSLVSRRNLEKNTIITREMLVSKTILLSHVKLSPVVNMKDIIGKRVVKGIRGGAPINQNMVENIPFVNKGTPVTITLKGSGFQLSAPGVILENGNMNDWVDVMNLYQRKKLKAQIKGAKQVEVRM